MKNINVRFIAWALFALIAFVTPSFAQKDGPKPPANAPELKFKIARSKKAPERTSFVQGDVKRLIDVWEITNMNSFTVDVERLVFDKDYSIQTAYIKQGNGELAEASWGPVREDMWAYRAPMPVVLMPGAKYEVYVYGTLRMWAPDEEYYNVYAMPMEIQARSYNNHITTFVESDSFNTTNHSVIRRAPDRARMANISGLQRLENPGVAYGFAISGPENSKAKVLVRVAGPALASLGVFDPLQDPFLRVIDSKGNRVGESNDWASPLASRFGEVGAFAFRSGSNDAAVELDLAPGTYTVEVGAIGKQTGAYLIETYELSNDPVVR
jgi:hypothetical protein